MRDIYAVGPLLRIVLRQRKWTQVDLARHLGVTQGYASRLMSGNHAPRPGLQQKIDDLLATAGTTEDAALLEQVQLALIVSPHFKTLVRTALRLMNNNE